MAFGVAVAVVSAGLRAHAGPPETARARDAYDRGVRAHAEGRHAAAARAFAEADALAPAPASLEAALESAMRADDPALGAELLDRTETHSSDARLRETVERARRAFGGRAGKLRVDCKSTAPCVVAVDGVAMDGARVVYVPAGAHAVVVQRGDERFERLVQVQPEQTVLVAEPQPLMPTVSAAVPSHWVPSEPPPRTGGVSAAWLVSGVAATTVAGGLALFSGLDVLARHDRFAADCGRGGTGPRAADCAARVSGGETAELRTNVLLVATAALAVTTVTLAVFAARSSGTRARVALAGPRVAVEIQTP